MTIVRRVPLLSGSRIVHVPLGDDDVVLRPPPPPTRVVDVEAAVRDALRFPLDGTPLAELCAGRERVTVVVEPPALPLPGAQADPRREALATVLDELDVVRHPRRTADAPRRGRALAKARPPRPRAPAATAAGARIPRARRRPRCGRPGPRPADSSKTVRDARQPRARRRRPRGRPLVRRDRVHGGPAALLAACDAATSAAAPRRTRSSRPPASRSGSLRSESRRHSARAFRCSESHSPSITRG